MDFAKFVLEQKFQIIGFRCISFENQVRFELKCLTCGFHGVVLCLDC